MQSATTAPDQRPTRAPGEHIVVLSRDVLVISAVVVAQAMWLGLLMLRGWYSGADLPNLAFANGRPLDWDYLSTSLGGHLGMAQRSVYWVLNRVAPLEWELTVLLRLVLQGVATVVLWRLLRALVGPRPWLPVVLVLYAFSPLLLPGLAALNSGLGLSVAQACLLGAALLHVRWVREHRPRDALLVALLILVMLLFAQQSAPGVLLLPLLSLVFLSSGPWRTRLAGAVRAWPGWAALVLALAVFAVLYASGAYNSGESDFGVGDALWLAGKGWTDVLGVALVGGPWSYTSLEDQWSAYAAPSVLAVLLGQAVLLALVTTSVLRTGTRALAAWSIPVGTAVSSLLLVGFGRWADLGEVIPAAHRYSYFVPAALAIGVTLAFARTAEEGQASGPTRWPHRLGALLRRPPRLPVTAALGLVLVLSAVSSWQFAQRFWENPARGWVTGLEEGVVAAGTDVRVFDTQVPERVVPYISRTFVSDVLALTGARAEFTGQGGDRSMVDEDGALVPAAFYKEADVRDPEVEDCGTWVSGAATTTLDLTPVSRTADWFLQLEAYQPRPNVLTIEVRDADGEVLEMAGGPVVGMAGPLVVVQRRLAIGTPATLTLSASDPQTDLCLVHAYVGVPVAR